MAYVYRHIRLDKNIPFYVGIGADEDYSRASSKFDRNNHWHNVAKKTEYVVEIIYDDLSWNEACDKEIEFILLYGRKDLKTGSLVNMTNGGDGSYGRIVTNETKKKISDFFKGKSPWNKGIKWKKVKKISDESRKKIGDVQRGKNKSEETKKKISESMLKHFKNKN